jgi:CheY-like chemotaxis protein
VILVLRRVEGEILPQEAHATAAPTAASDDLTVLVIDDDPDVRQFLCASLDGLGYQVVEAADGAAGLILLDARRPDLLVVDFAMPGMNGAEVATAARARRPDLPIIVASGYADTEALDAAIVGPAARMLHKPFSLAELAQAVEAALTP